MFVRQDFSKQNLGRKVEECVFFFKKKNKLEKKGIFSTISLDRLFAKIICLLLFFWINNLI